MPATEEQMQLIDVDHPEAKALKKLISKYEGLVQERKTAKEKENAAREAVVEKVREIGKADKAGNIYVQIEGVNISIEPDEKVKIKHGSSEDDEELPDEEEVAEGEEQESRRGRVSNKS